MNIRKARRISKAIVAALTSIGIIVATTVPDYSDEYQLGFGVVIAVLGALGVYQIPNRDPGA